MNLINNMNGRTSISIPRELKLEIDRERGDVSRSRFLLRILEKSRVGYLDTRCTHTDETKKSPKNSVEDALGIWHSTESLIT